MGDIKENSLTQILRNVKNVSWSSSSNFNVLSQGGEILGSSGRNSWYNIGQLDPLMNDDAIRTYKFIDKADKLFDKFCNLLEMRTNEFNVFYIVSQMARTCRNLVEDPVKNLNSYTKNEATKNVAKTAIWLESEMKTWELIHDLYYDRQLQQDIVDEEIDDELVKLRNRSERTLAAVLVGSNSSLREYQLIVDWLERSYKNEARRSMIRRLTTKCVGWNNTLFQLKKGTGVSADGSFQLVKSIDLDAPMRENRSLHLVDWDDQILLSKIVFYDIRAGRLSDAIVLLNEYGQPLKAVLYEGWRLFEDRNYVEEGNTFAIQGNPTRDVWKKSAFRVCDSKEGDEYHRASLGALCGHLDSMKTVLQKWEDLLWAHLKVQIDIKLEIEIRKKFTKRYVPMPNRYWSQITSTVKIFEKLGMHPIAGDYANSYAGVVQKYIILNDPGELLNQISIWIDDATNSPNVELTAHHLRFFTHVILFLKQINAIENDDQVEKVISAYVEELIMKREPHLVAFYSSCLSPQMQINLYSKFLEPIKGRTARLEAVEEATEMRLNVEKILKATVERAQEYEPNSYDLENTESGCISEFDENRINSLEWLTFLPSLRVELFWQSNSLIRYYLGEQKIDCVKAVLKVIPIDGVNAIIADYGDSESLPAIERMAIKEHLSYKLYIDALNLFDEWYDMFQKCPKHPDSPADQKQFSERVAMEQKIAAYQQNHEKWLKAFDEQTIVTRDALFQILSFPEGGWLVDPEPMYSSFGGLDLDLENRSHQLKNIRSIYVPEMILLLYQMLTIRKDRHGCMQVANIVAREMNQLYSSFPREKLADLLYKLADTSIEFLNSDLDPWGFPNSS